MKCGFGTEKDPEFSCPKAATVGLQSRTHRNHIFIRCKEHSLELILRGLYDVIDLEDAENFTVVYEIMKS